MMAVRGDRAAERRRVEVLLAAVDEVERAALERDDALARHRLAAVDERAPHGAVLQRDGRDRGRILLVGLREVGRVRVDLHALAASQATAQRVSRPPEKAMPSLVPLGGSER